MIKKEIAEIKRQFTPANCSISRICGCYVDGEKNKKADFKEAFLSLPEEDMFKYFELLRKNLSGTLGKNLIYGDPYRTDSLLLSVPAHPYVLSAYRNHPLSGFHQ